CVTLFTSSLRDRPPPELPREIPSVRISDHRIPVRLLNLAWHRAEWPPVEWSTGASFDVAFSPHPLLMPSRGAARVVMVHDLDFLTHPERTTREVRRDYPTLAGPHARRADRVIVPSPYTADEVARRLDIPLERIAVCPPGTPEWKAPVRGVARQGYLLFFGTLEPRKNVGGLLDAYEQLVAEWPDVPRLVLAGRAGPEAAAWLDRLAGPTLRGRVEHLGYVAGADRQRVYEGARALVLPSFDEGFGMPVLEAMSLGIPVVVSAQGALPWIIEDAGLSFDPSDETSLCRALHRVMTDDGLAETLGQSGRARAQAFSWHRTADAVRTAFEEAIRARSRHQ
ncbi:MAG: glycosyltransferase family 4 protein, partial [Acidobacteriota bacterium]